MIAEKYIRRFNRLNGNQVSRDTLRDFYFSLKKDIDNKRIDAHVPFGVECLDILKRLAAFIKNMGDADIVEKVILTPIPLDRYKVSPSAAQKTKREEANEKRSKAGVGLKELIDLRGPEKYMLSGLEEIQDDTQFKGAPLGAIGDSTYKVITDKILSLIEAGGLIWRKPWNANHQGKEGHAHNYVTKTFYRGTNFYLNYLLLDDFKTPYFFTFKQVDDLGGKVKEGQKGWPVIYFKWLYKKIGGGLVEESEAMVGNKLKAGYDKFPALFYYTVFNYEQCTGLKVKPYKTVKLTVSEKIESCERIVENMPQRPVIQNVKGDRAFYRPSTDSVTMPMMEQFENEQKYYSVLFHELIHATGSPDRLKREKGGKFGDKKYAFEELIAELGASYLCGESGIFYFTMKGSAAYIKSWSGALVSEMKADNKFFLKAAAAAEKGSEFILGKSKPAKKSKVKKAVKETAPVNGFNKLAKEAPQPNHQKTDKSGVSGLPAKTSKSSSHSGVNYKYTAMDLGPFQNDYHRLFSDSIVQIHGSPGHGKTTHLLKFGNHLSKKSKVLYIAREEYGRSVFDIKLKEQKISAHRNLRFTKFIEPEDMQWASVVFLDSATALKLNPAGVEQLTMKYPNRLWFVVLQSTKDGDFRGSNEWEHLVDVAGEVHNRKLILRKNRLDQDNAKKAEQLRIEDIVHEKKQQAHIKEMVKKATKVESKPKEKVL